MATNIIAGDNSNGFQVNPDASGALTFQTGPAGAKVNALSIAADGTPTFLKVPANAAVQSMVRVNTAAGYGSTNTGVRRYTNTVTSQGADITYTPSAINGDLFTINTAGVYAISASDNWNTALSFALTLNATTLSAVSIATQPVGVVLVAATTTTAGYEACASWTGYLAAGSLIRVLVDGGGVTPVGAGHPAQFTITRVA